MTTAHQLLAQAMANLLKQDPPVAGGRVYVGRTRAINTESPSGVVIMLGRSACNSSVMGSHSSWSTLLAVECYGRSMADGPDTADELVEAVFARLSTDPGLGGLAMDVEPLDGDTLQWDHEVLDTNLGCITAKFLVRHQTNQRILTT